MKKCLSAVAFVLLLLVSLAVIYPALAWKDTTGGYRNNVQQLHATGEDLIDLAFVGSSHVYCGVNPALLWDEAGIAAFDLSVSSMDKVSTGYFLEELFKTQSPQVICLDLYALLYDRQDIRSNEYINYLALPPSLRNLQSILEYGPQDPLAFVTRFPIIHSRYRELTAFDFVQYQPSLFGRGNYYTFHVEAFEPQDGARTCTEVTQLSPQNQAWLDQMLALCREQDCQLITVVLPFWISPREQAIVNGAKAYLARQGVECLDMNQADAPDPFDYDRDFADVTHLNYGGARKATAWLLQELQARYDLPDRRGDERYTLWQQNSGYDLYQRRLQQLAAQQDPEALTVLNTLGGLTGCTLVVSLPPEWEELDTARQTLTAAGIPTDQLDRGGQWVLQDGAVLGYLPPDTDQVFTRDLNPIHNLTVNGDGSGLVAFNGLEYPPETGVLSVVAYDNYEAAVLYPQA